MEETQGDRQLFDGWMAAVSAGDRAAFACLYDRLKAPVYGLALSILRVRDDGVGMPDEQVERLNAQFGGVGGADMTQPCGGIALRNVNSRIRLMFGEDYGLHLFSAAGVGTECCVTLPLRFREA